jgi:hypothetical protein
MTDNILFKAIDRCRCHLKGKLLLIGETLEYVYHDKSSDRRWNVYLEDRQKLRSLCPGIQFATARQDSDTISIMLML